MTLALNTPAIRAITHSHERSSAHSKQKQSHADIPLATDFRFDLKGGGRKAVAYFQSRGVFDETFAYIQFQGANIEGCVTFVKGL